jgi:AraC-like DNA-binding protein
MHEKRFRKHVIRAAGTYKTLLDDHCAIGDPVSHLSSVFGISRNVLQQAFKNQFGMGVREYKLQQRMEKSCKLLEEDRDIKEIAIMLHYSKPRAFSTAFRRFYGITPTEYINKLRGNTNGDKQV